FVAQPDEWHTHGRLAGPLQKRHHSSKLNTTTQQDAGALRDPAPTLLRSYARARRASLRTNGCRPPARMPRRAAPPAPTCRSARPDEPHRAPAREPYSATVEPRTTSWHGSVCTPWERLPSIASKMARAARRPRALKFMSTLVNCGRAPV